jgi:hypothetical protein
MEQQNGASEPTFLSVPKSDSKKNNYYLLMGILLLIVVSISSYYLGVASQQKTIQAITTNDRETVSRTPTPTPSQTWKTYTDAQYHFSFQYPPDWTITRLDNYIFVTNMQKNTLSIGFKYKFNETRIVRTGVGAGTFIEQGSVKFLNMDIPRNVLVYYGRDYGVLYKYATEIEVSDLVFSLGFDAEGEGYLTKGEEETADKIVTSLKLNK